MAAQKKTSRNRITTRERLLIDAIVEEFDLRQKALLECIAAFGEDLRREMREQVARMMLRLDAAARENTADIKHNSAAIRGSRHGARTRTS